MKMRRVLSVLMAAAMMLGVSAVPAAEAKAAMKREHPVVAFAGKEKAAEMDLAQVVESYGGEEMPLSEYESGVLYLVNKIRMNNGLQPLTTSTNILRATDIRAQELIQKFDHMRPDGSDCFTALDQCGVTYNTAGENIAAGQMDPIMVVESWMNSQRHRENILNQAYTHLGVGHAFNANTQFQNYWVQLFTGSCQPTEIKLNVDTSPQNMYYYVLGQTMEDLGLIMEVKCPHGVSYMPVIDEMCTPVDESLVEAPQKVTISYAGKSIEMYVYVVPPLPFVDVDESHWFYDYVADVYYNGVMTGLTQERFGPVEPLARAQFAMILYRLMGEDPVEYTKVFPDVPQGQWFTNAVLWASKSGIVSGYAHNGHFGPGDRINREQMAVMMYRFANFLGMPAGAQADLSHFTDANKVNAFAEEAMSWAVATGIITGKNNGTVLDPQGNAIRAECAAIIVRFVNYMNSMQL